MKKLQLDPQALRVESFSAAAAGRQAGTVRGYLSAYYEICSPGDSYQQTCTCEPTCNAATCYNCASAGCGTGDQPACTSTCYPVSAPVTGCDFC